MVAVVALAVCAFPLRRMLMEEAAKTPDTAWQIYVFLFGAHLQAAVFLFALYQGFKLLGFFGGNTPFSELSVRALQNIKYAAVLQTLVQTPSTRPRPTSTNGTDNRYNLDFSWRHHSTLNPLPML